MARVKRSVNAQKKRRETLERAAGYRGQRSRLYRKAKEQVTHSLVYSYRDRKATTACLRMHQYADVGGHTRPIGEVRGRQRSAAFDDHEHLVDRPAETRLTPLPR